MKIRITRNSLRFRLKQPEVQALHQTQRISETLELGNLPRQQIQFVLKAGPCEEAALHFEDNILIVQVPKEVAGAWAQSEQVGIYETITMAGGKTVELTIEKDFACLDATADENAGTYPNPKASCEFQADESSN